MALCATAPVPDGRKGYAPRMTVRVLGLFDNGDEGGGNAVRRGAPSHPFAYGAQHLHGDDFELVRVNPARHRLHRRTRDIVEHRTGLRVDRTVRSLSEAARADAVLAFLEREGALASRLRARGWWPMRDTPLVALSCWWAEELRSGPSEARHRILQDAAGMDRIVVFSSNQVDVFADHGIRPERVVPVAFSVDATWYCPDTQVARDRDVVAIGVDRGRDWRTLVDAARRLPDARFDILTQPGRLDPAGMPSNVYLHGVADAEEYRQWLRSARVVAVPTHDLAYPTGQSVLLEASATGACVAVTATAAMDDYVRAGDTAIALPLHDPVGVASVLQGVLADDTLRGEVGGAARRAVEESFAYPGMWLDVRRVIRALV
jgi:glycosyltransferase involved in cell wall biosynthesis